MTIYTMPIEFWQDWKLVTSAIKGEIKPLPSTLERWHNDVVTYKESEGQYEEDEDWEYTE